MTRQANILSYSNANNGVRVSARTRGQSSTGNTRASQLNRARNHARVTPTKHTTARNARTNNRFYTERLAATHAHPYAREQYISSQSSRERTHCATSEKVRRGIISYDDFLKEEQNNQEYETPRSKTNIFTKFSNAKKKRAKEKAGRAFDKQFSGTSSPSNASEGPRAAVYKGEMGRSQRRSQRMQAGMSPVQKIPRSSQSRDNKDASVAAWFGRVFTSLFTRKRNIAALSVAACLVIAGVFMYPAAKQYYTEMRHLDKVNAEYQAVTNRNAELTSTRDYLKSSAGVEELAHEKYGWVKEGENSVLVYGLADNNTIADTNLYIQRGSVSAPETWYSVILDPLFGVE